MENIHRYIIGIVIGWTLCWVFKSGHMTDITALIMIVFIVVGTVDLKLKKQKGR